MTPFAAFVIGYTCERNYPPYTGGALLNDYSWNREPDAATKTAQALLKLHKPSEQELINQISQISYGKGRYASGQGPEQNTKLALNELMEELKRRSIEFLKTDPELRRLLGLAPSSGIPSTPTKVTPPPVQKPTESTRPTKPVQPPVKLPVVPRGNDLSQALNDLSAQLQALAGVL